MERYWYILFAKWSLFIVCLALLNKEIYSDNSEWLKSGKCRGKWRPEKMPGKCTGMNQHIEFEELKHLREINNATACRALCCNLGEKCITWQYEIYSKECRFGPVMRLGNEAAGVPGWCEPFAPVKWNGRRIVNRNDDGTIRWSDVDLNTQCFGLGDERKASNGGHMSTEECKAACAADKECEIWQEFPGRGCFYNRNKGIFCDEKKIARYEGGRKCIPKYCGGMEEQILGMKPN